MDGVAASKNWKTKVLRAPMDWNEYIPKKNRHSENVPRSRRVRPLGAVSETEVVGTARNVTRSSFDVPRAGVFLDNPPLHNERRNERKHLRAPLELASIGLTRQFDTKSPYLGRPCARVFGIGVRMFCVWFIDVKEVYTEIVRAHNMTQ